MNHYILIVNVGYIDNHHEPCLNDAKTMLINERKLIFMQKKTVKLFENMAETDGQRI